jgi:hypothetical protein
MLAIDPDGLKVEVLKDKIPGWPIQPQCSVSGAAVYFTARTATRNTEVIRIGAPGLRKEVLAPQLPPSEDKITRTFVHDGRIHVVLAQIEIPSAKAGGPWRPMYQWWTLDTDGKNLRQVATNLPAIRHVGVSSHYGLVAIVETKFNNSLAPTTLNTVEIVSPKK